jgi:hypothetical protein
MTIHVQALTSASGFLNGKVFQGTFEATLIYQETNFKISSRGDFEAHLA